MCNFIRFVHFLYSFIVYFKINTCMRPEKWEWIEGNATYSVSKCLADSSFSNGLVQTKSKNQHGHAKMWKWMRFMESVSIDFLIQMTLDAFGEKPMTYWIWTQCKHCNLESKY